MYAEYLKGKDYPSIRFDASVFPTAEDRDFWNSVPDEVRQQLTAGAEAFLGEPWPQVTCAAALAFVRNGDRLAMENDHFEKRKRLAKLVAAECFEHEGRYLDEIMNGLVFIAGEPFWGVSAHYPADDSMCFGDGERQNYIDLFAAETASLIARTVHLLRKDLMRECAELVFYLEAEIQRRIISVFLSHDEFWWMGFNRKRKLNNWSPWITSQLITVFLLTEKNDAVRHEGILKCMRIQDLYLSDVPFDGGIDEGPGYWGVAGGKMLESIRLLSEATHGAIDLSADEQIRNITDYVRKVYVGNGWFVNFNDASPIGGADANMIGSFAKLNGCGELLSFAKEMAKHYGVCSGARNLSIFFNGLEFADELLSAGEDSGWASENVYSAGIELAAAREKEGSDEGLFFAAKGSHNAESHNHNDAGNVVVYKNGVPFLIDLGQGTYTKKTFSEHRYEIGNCRSIWHNLPVVNGIEQIAGAEHKAENTAFSSLDNGITEFSTELHSAYGTECGAETIQRRVVFDRREKTVEVTDRFLFTEETNTVQETLVLRGSVCCADGKVTVTADGNEIVIEPIGRCGISDPEEYTEDALITSRFGAPIYRVLLTYECSRQATAGYRLR